MTDPFAEFAAEQAAQRQAARQAALRERAASATRPVTREGSAPAMRWEGGRRGGTNIDDRRPASGVSVMDRIGATANRVNGFLNPGRVGGNADERAGRETAQGAMAGIIRAPAVLAGSLMDFGEDTGRFVATEAAARFARGNPERQAALREALMRTTPMGIAAGHARRLLGMGDDDTWSDTLSGRETLGRVGHDGVNQGVAVVTASIIPAFFTGGLGGAGLAGAATRTVAIGAFGGGVVNDPYSERISNGLQQIGVRNEFTDWLAQDDDDSVMESRFKGAVEGVLAEGAAEAVFWAAKAAWLLAKGRVAEAGVARETARKAAGIADEARPPVREGTPQEAAKENLDKTFAQVRAEEARAAEINQRLAAEEASATGAAPDAAPGQAGTQEAPANAAQGDEATPAVQEVGSGTRATDGLPPVGAEGSPEYIGQSLATLRTAIDTGVTRDGKKLTPARRRVVEGAIAHFEAQEGSLLADANAVLDRAGVAARLENLSLSPTGKIEVPAEVKAALDEAGMGRAFSIAEDTGIPRDDVIFATAGGRVVGTMGREDVEAFKAEITQWAADGVDDVGATQPAGAFKLTNLGDPENVQPLLRAMVDRVPPKVRLAMGDVQRAAQGLADDLGEDTTAILAYAQGVADDADGMATAVAAIRTMWTRLGKDIDQSLDIDIDSLTDDAFRELASRIHNMTAFSASWAQTKTGLGRGLRVIGMADADTYLANVGKHAEDALTPRAPDADPMLPRTREEVKDWLETWKAFKDDPKGRAAWLDRKFKIPSAGLYLRSSVANFFTANLLSAPRTLMLNVVGPAIIGAVRTIEKSSGGFVAAMMPGVPAARRAELMATAAASPRAYLQAFGDMQDTLRFSLQAMRRGEPILGGGGSIRDASGQLGPVSPQMIAAAGGTKVPWAYAAGNAINLWPRALQKANAGMDEFSKRLAYLGEARAGLLVEGATKGLRGTDLNEYVRNGLTQTTDALGHATDDVLLRSAERTTFTGEVGSEGSLARSFAGGVSKARQQFPELRYIMPIFNVPANALGETLRRVPVINVLFKESREELIGALGPVRQAEAYGRFITGTALLGSGLALSRMGLITGSGPKDPRDRAIWLQTHQPYSLRVGDTWVDYSRYDIVGALLAIPATLYDKSVYSPQDKGWEHAMYGGIAAMAEYMKDRAALQSIAEVLSFSSSPTSNPEAFFERLAGTTLANIAVPNFITALGRNPTDDVIRAKAGVADYIFDKLPGLSQTLDPVRNIFGEYVHKPQDSLLEGVFPVTMAQAVSFNDDPEMDEVSRLYEATGYAAGVISPRQTMGGAFDPREVKLPGGWSLWNEVMRNRGVVTVEGRTLREALGDLFGSEEYEAGIDADASNKNLSDGRVSRGALVAEVFTAYNKAALVQTARESPEAARWLAVAKAKRTDDGLLRPYGARELVDNPDLMASLGIDITTYEEGLTGE